MARTRVKICGITRPADALAAARAGADAIGLVFHPASPRAVTIEQARAIVAALPPFVMVVGLFVNATPELVRATLQAVPLDLLQFHGEEEQDYCAAFGKPWIKAIRVQPQMQPAALQTEMAGYTAARGILLDAWHKDVHGGSGQSFDWEQARRSGLQQLQDRIILAGGLNTGNVATAIGIIRPWAVDVSSGVETAPGHKSEQSMQAFVQEVQRV
jgi:phosphoribosylanthranilate isomerase